MVNTFYNRQRNKTVVGRLFKGHLSKRNVFAKKCKKWQLYEFKKSVKSSFTRKLNRKKYICIFYVKNKPGFKLTYNSAKFRGRGYHKKKHDKPFMA